MCILKILVTNLHEIDTNELIMPSRTNQLKLNSPKRKCMIKTRHLDSLRKEYIRQHVGIHESHWIVL